MYPIEDTQWKKKLWIATRYEGSLGRGYALESLDAGLGRKRLLGASRTWEGIIAPRRPSSATHRGIRRRDLIFMAPDRSRRAGSRWRVPSRSPEHHSVRDRRGPGIGFRY